jgi:hypothetical protein
MFESGADVWKGAPMSKIATTLTVLALAAVPLLVDFTPARAENGQITAGIAGGLIGGALIGGALASRPAYAPPPPVYYEPAPAIIEEPVCRVVREQYWDGYGYRIRRVQVCD